MVRNYLQLTVWKIEELNMNRETVRVTLSSKFGLEECDKIISQNLIGKHKIRKKIHLYRSFSMAKQNTKSASVEIKPICLLGITGITGLFLVSDQSLLSLRSF
jgi:hypothetical protein